MPIVNLLLASLVMPLIVIGLLAIRARRPLGGWLATLLLAAGVAGFSILAAPWGWFGVPLRIVLVLLFATAVVVSLRRAPAPDAPPDSIPRIFVKVVVGLFFGSVAVSALSARAVPEHAIDLAFPLRGGTFLVAHGGSTAAANIHAQHPAQRFALDVVKLNRAGMRARGLYPFDPARYAIYGAPVLSPCDGSVLRAVDGHPDHRPPAHDPKNVAGNHVVLGCGDSDVWLAHLQRGSVLAKAGTRVARGTPLALAGNSGNTSEPHLHVHAERNGRAVPVTFDGRWLVRNAMVRQ